MRRWLGWFSISASLILFISVAWLFTSPSYEPLISVLAALSSILGLLVGENQGEASPITIDRQNKSTGDNSTLLTTRARKDPDSANRLIDTNILPSTKTWRGEIGKLIASAFRGFFVGLGVSLFSGIPLICLISVFSPIEGISPWLNPGYWTGTLSISTWILTFGSDNKWHDRVGSKFTRGDFGRVIADIADELGQGFVGGIVIGVISILLGIAISVVIHFNTMNSTDFVDLAIAAIITWIIAGCALGIALDIINVLNRP